MAAHPNSVTETFPWDKELIRKYDVAGPRYTSYPTAAQFSEDFNGDAFIAYLKQRPQTIAPLSLYVHIPFCRDICYYCACNKLVTRKPGVAAKYLAYLEKEARILEDLFHRRCVSQLHLGGGTPTYFDNAELTQLMYVLSQAFKLHDGNEREYSIEVDPRTVQPKTLALLKGLGFNRISMGIQDFDGCVQKAINRVQPFDLVKQLTESARHLEFNSLSFDLIYGLPYQSTASMAETLSKVLDLRPDRISCYSYAHLPHRFTSQRSISRLAIPGAEEKLDILKLIADKLTSAGYEYIGMDHFVVPEDGLAKAAREGKLHRNFQGYSTRHSSELLGLGVSAIGSNSDLYVQNAHRLDDYYASLDKGILPINKVLQLNKEDHLRRDVIMSLICNMQVSFAEIESKHKINFNKHFREELNTLKQAQSEGIIDVSQNSLCVTEIGRPLVRNLCMIFDQHLETTPQRFSRTI